MGKLFNRFLLLWGIILILASVLLELNLAPCFQDNTQAYYGIIYMAIVILGKICSAVGISFVVNWYLKKQQKSDFAKEENKKIIKELVESDICPSINSALSRFVSDPTTISCLEADAKAALISGVVMKNDGLDEYRIKQLKSITSDWSVFRINGSYSGEAYKEDGIVFFSAVIKYQLKFNCGVADYIEKTFVSEDTAEVSYVKFSNPDNPNENCIIPQRDLSKKRTTANGTSFEFLYETKVPTEFEHLNLINVEKKMVFKGSDHWVNSGWLNSLPTQCFNISINCKDGLIIKEKMIFDSTDTYFLSTEEACVDRFIAYTYQWANPFTGFVVTIGEPNND